LIVGIFAAISPSYMVGAQAFLMNNNYEQDYGMHNSHDKQSYGKDYSYYKSKDSSNIKCNNINVNLNGDIDIGASQALSALATEAQAEDEGEIGANSLGNDGGRPSGSDSDFKLACIYNNIPPEEKCADIEACFEENLLPEEFELLTNALKNGITVEISEENIVSLNSFEDICEVLEGLSPLVVEGAILQILQAANIIGLPIDLVTCIAEVLDIQIIER
jgi:hypothetical protein